jgi:hypothetical protein
VDGVFGRLGGIILVWISAGNWIHALANQVRELMRDFAAFTTFLDAPGQSLRRLRLGIDRLLKRRAIVRTAGGLIETGEDEFGGNIEKQNGLCGILPRLPELRHTFG